MKKVVRVGIIGSGFARSTQIPGFQNCPKTEVVSIASGKLENAESAAKEFGIPHFTDNWRETVAREDIDLISIVTPPAMHKEMTLAAIEAGKAVLCEKPMAMNADETREMLEAANAKGVLALIDHELRFVKGRRVAHEMIRAGHFGKIRHAKYHFCNAMRGNENLPWSWWSDLGAGGGAIGAIGSHVIDSFSWFLGTEVSTIFCQLNTHIKERPLESDKKTKRPVTSDDECLMTLRFADSELVEDATGSVSISMVEAGNYRNSVEFFGTKGAVRIEDGGEVFVADITENVWMPFEIELGEVAPKMRVGGWSRGFTVFSERVVEAIRKGENYVKGAVTFEDGYRIQLVLDAARKSNETGEIVKVWA